MGVLGCDGGGRRMNMRRVVVHDSKHQSRKVNGEPE
jgi:hypothetical protein